MYRIYTGYDPVRIITHVGKNSTFDKVAKQAGLTGPYEDVASLPQDKSDRDAWEVKNGRVKVNASKKAMLDAAKAARNNKMNSTKAKLKQLGFTDDEIKLLKIG